MILPLFPLNVVLFPGTELPLHVFEQRYRSLIRERRNHDPAFGVVSILKGLETGEQFETALIGTEASIVAIRDHDDGRHDLVVRGGKRFRIVDHDRTAEYLVGTVEWLPEITADPLDSRLLDAAWLSFVKLANAYVRQAKGLGVEPVLLESDGKPIGFGSAELGYMLASRLPVPIRERQALLESDSVAGLLTELIRIMSRERRLVSHLGATVVIAGRGSSDTLSDRG
jgi:Lon protease-like protein